ncbi:sensor histidine kinase [Arthrobacter sp. CDRTa11]|uniref:sensor histidine kinase n=1 Tax=Arthrobacter sp. CDRTa11 TaxID=2651199 RepID=UPI002265835C|nr:HAMP domain-containing sensor histidine kinase [Arthrobacter sp. CDRTa11]
MPEKSDPAIGRGRRTAGLTQDPQPIERLDAFFGGLGARGKVVLSQLPLSVTVVLVVVTAAVFSPETLADKPFQMALLAHTAIFGLCVALPWKRLPAGAYVLIPVLDCLAIGFTREAGGPTFNVMSLLLVFPVVWLSVTGHRVGVALAVLAVVLSTLVPAATLGSDPMQGSMVRTIFLPLIMAAIAVTAHVVSGALHRQRQTLERKDRDLADTLAESVRRQQLLDAVLSAVGVGVWVVDKDGHSVLTNTAMRTDPALVELIRENGPHLLLFSDRTTAVPSEDFPVRRAVQGDTFTDELYWAGPEQEQRAYSVSAHLMPSVNNAGRGAVVTFVDVTALINALAAKDNFVATVSHELRTPLTSILGYLELILDEPGYEEIKPELGVVHRNASHLLGLVNDLIAVASERVELALQEADLAPLLAHVVESARLQAAEKGLELVLDAEQALTARMDPVQIRQVLGHLMSNAIKFSPHGGKITALARRAGTELVCSITDTGIGMSREDQEQAFTKFFRSARSRETAIPGAGIGLPISKTIVEGHGGSISLTSTQGEGTTATFVLPVS